MVGLLDFSASGRAGGGDINCETFQSRGKTEGEVASDTAGAERFFGIFDDAIKIIKPDNALI